MDGKNAHLSASARGRRFWRLVAAPTWESWYPRAIGFACGIGATVAGATPARVDSVIENAFPILIATASVLAGFQAASLAVMMSVLSTPIMKYLQSTGHYRVLLGFQWSAIRSLLVFVLGATALYGYRWWMVPTDNERCPDCHWISAGIAPVAIGGSTALFVHAVLSAYRVTGLMFKILKSPSGPPTDGTD